MAKKADKKVKKTDVWLEAQHYRDEGYKIIAIIGEGGSGKSTLGNLYCGWTEHPPFHIEHGQREGTKETTGFADTAKGIYWLDTRGVGFVFDFSKWMGLLEELGLIDGLILVGYPQQRPLFGQQMETFSAYLKAQGFHCLKVFRRDLLSIAKAAPQMYEDFVPFDKDTPEPRVVAFIEQTRASSAEPFRVVDVFHLTLNVIDLRRDLDEAKRKITELERDKAALRAQLEELQRTSAAKEEALNSKFDQLDQACKDVVSAILNPRSNRHRSDDNHMPHYRRSGEVRMNDELIRSHRKLREQSFKLKVLVDELRGQERGAGPEYFLLSPSTSGYVSARTSSFASQPSLDVIDQLSDEMKVPEGVWGSDGVVHILYRPPRAVSALVPGPALTANQSPNASPAPELPSSTHSPVSLSGPGVSTSLPLVSGPVSSIIPGPAMSPSS